MTADPGALRRWVDVLGPARSPHHEEPSTVRTRRRVVVALTSVAGAVLLGLTLQTDAGSAAFYPLALALAATWALGALLSGPLHLGRLDGRRHVLVPAVIGAVMFAGFAVGAVVVRHVPLLDHAVASVIGRADTGHLALVLVVALVNGLAEELFFRGAVQRPRPAPAGALVDALLRRRHGGRRQPGAGAGSRRHGHAVRTGTAVDRGVLAPATTHLVWSTLMIFFLPR